MSIASFMYKGGGTLIGEYHPKGLEDKTWYALYYPSKIYYIGLAELVGREDQNGDRQVCPAHWFPHLKGALEAQIANTGRPRLQLRKKK